MSAQTIQDQAAKTYQNNLNYLENNHPKLFHTLVSLDFAIDAKHYEERYALEYRDEGYFDVKELATEIFLYGEDSKDYAKQILPEKETLEKSQKVIFYGTGLATHIPMIDALIDNSAAYLIVEDDLELFRLSLFVVDFSKLAKNVSLFFSVMQERELFNETFTAFYQKEESYNDYIQYFVFSSRYMQKVEDVKLLIEDLSVSAA